MGEIVALSPGDPRLLPALDLVWRVFQEFEAPDYSPEGIEEFGAYIRPDNIRQGLETGALRLWVRLEGEGVVGVLATRGCHISLLFVDASFHRRGIARALYQGALAQLGCREVTVHSSPYAQEAYRRLGFVPTGEEQTVNGLRFIPMCHRLPGE